ncbi:hypothetical protein, partial [Candidatus Venteria ishoeyi]|uniref:hypothetical protein n=1 Tax=Candidatus Venteria ishoeyi TaxID=1899563 RepID=UPI00255C62F0
LVPYHPQAYSHFEENKEYSFTIEFEKYINHMAKKKGISVYGSYNPKTNLVEGSDFYDAMHLRVEGLKKLGFGNT